MRLHRCKTEALEAPELPLPACTGEAEESRKGSREGCVGGCREACAR